MHTSSIRSGHIRGHSNRRRIHGDHRSISMMGHSAQSCNQRRSLAHGRNQGRRHGDHDHGQVTPATHICQHTEIL
jgi:hypothetical protein